MKALVWLPLLFLTIGTVLSVVGVCLVISAFQFSAEAKEVSGTISGIANGKPVVKYEIEEKSYSLTCKISTSPPMYSSGDVVTVIYQSENPGNATIKSFAEQWFLPLAFVCGGVTNFTIGLCMPMLLRKFGPSFGYFE